MMPSLLPALTSAFLFIPNSNFDLLVIRISTVVPLQQATVHGVTHDPIVYYATLPLPVKDELPIYALSKDTTIANDACDPLPSDTPDLSPYLVIIRRGTCAFVSYNSTNASSTSVINSYITNVDSKVEQYCC